MSRLKDKYGNRIDKTDRYKHPIGLMEIWVIIFIILKVTGIINWSWWWVLAPWWIPMSIAVFGFFGIIFFLTIKWILER